MRRMLERALAFDPKFAAARAEYAFSNVVMLFEGSSNDPSLLYKAEEEIRQALQNDPGCGRAHSVLAVIYLLQGRKELIPGEVNRALRANPDRPKRWTGSTARCAWAMTGTSGSGEIRYWPTFETIRVSSRSWPR